MKYRVKESSYLAMTAARTAVAHGQAVDAEDAKQVFSILDNAAEANQRRGAWVGQACSLFTRIIEEGHLGQLPEPIQDLLTDLHQRGIPLTVDDLGLTREAW